MARCEGRSGASILTPICYKFFVGDKNGGPTLDHKSHMAWSAILQRCMFQSG